MRLSTPIVALTSVLPTAAPNTSASTSRIRSSDGRNPGTSERAQAPSTASRVFPTVTPRALISGSLEVMFDTNAPNATPGHSRRPPNTSAASESPVGGQIAVTCLVANANRKPVCAAP